MTPMFSPVLPPHRLNGIDESPFEVRTHNNPSE